MGPLEWYILLVIIGFILIALEVVIIGGALGVVGGCCLLGATIIGFKIFGFMGGMVSLIGLMLGTCAFMYTWIKIFPNTALGRLLTLDQSIDEEQGVVTRVDLLDRVGTATTDLRPGGVARIDEQRVNVESASGYIDKGATIKVVKVEGIRIVVKKV